MHSLDTAQKAQRIENSKERQRHFMEQLQRKVQDRKQQSEASSKPCMAALLASAAKKVGFPAYVWPCLMEMKQPTCATYISIALS